MLESNENSNADKKISELKDSIHAIQAEEKKFKAEYISLKNQRNSLRNQISLLVAETREIRKARDSLTAEVKAEKTKRGELNSQIKDKFSSIKSLTPAQPGQKNAGMIKHAINAINKKIETEVISFEKEKEMMKTLHKLEKEYAAAMKAQEAYSQKKEVSTELKDLKTDADKIHVDIQQKAKLSQENHEKAVANSKKIDELVKSADELTAVMDEKEKVLKDYEAKLDAKFTELRALTGEARQTEQTFKKQKAESAQKILSQKRAEVEEKLKKGEKLTTADLLVMQSGD